MPRSRGGGGAPRRAPVSSGPSRPAAPARAAPPPQQSRPASTAVANPQAARQGQQQGQQGQQGQQAPGLFGQMASTAAGVAVGSSIGHAIGGFFGGGSSSAPVEQQQQQTAAASNDGYYAGDNTGSSSYSTNGAAPCETDVNNFRRCLDQNQGDMTICGWYLDQLKACQAAAKPY